MKRDIRTKIQNLLNQVPSIDEDQVRSLMILLRKRLELMPEIDKLHYSTMNLFCNWCAHTSITQSMTGLKTLARINDVLVKVKNLSIDVVRKEMSEAVGFGTLRLELIAFLDSIGVIHNLSDKKVFVALVEQLIEIIRDVPLEFPPISKLNKQSIKIYNQIIQNPIKLGAGVISMILSRINYGALGVKGLGELLCLLVKTEDTTTVVIPLEIHL